MKLISKRQCRCCKELFSPNYRSAKRQMFCNKPECRKASKAASQLRWTKNNPSYFTGSDNVERVREWRRANPGRHRRKGSGDVLQDVCDQIADANQDVIPYLPPELPVLAPVLQDFCMLQHPVFVGLIAHLTGCVLQDDIAVVTRRLEQLGQDVICSTRGGCHDLQFPNLPRPNPHHSRTVQVQHIVGL